MAIKPVRQVVEKTFPCNIRKDLAERLHKLATLPPATTTPYLTVSLDWRPAGSNPQLRPGLQRFEQEARNIWNIHWPRGAVFDSIGSDIAKINEYLEHHADTGAQGIFIVANSGADVFETFMLGFPLATSIDSGPVPALLPLAKLDEDHPEYAVLLADQQEATVSLFTQGRRLEQLRLRSSDYPRKQQTGGWSQRRFQQRADERLMALARRISTETQEYLEKHGVDALIIAGDELMTGAIDRTLSDGLRRHVLEVIRLDNGASEQELIEATLPIATRAEEQREIAAAQLARELIERGANAVAGAAEVLEALAYGQVRTLIMNEDFNAAGWADFSKSRYGAGDDSNPVSSIGAEFEAVPIRVEQEMVRLAIQTGAEIDIVHVGVPIGADSADVSRGGTLPRSRAAAELDGLGGVAAILRYS